MDFGNLSGIQNAVHEGRLRGIFFNRDRFPGLLPHETVLLSGPACLPASLDGKSVSMGCFLERETDEDALQVSRRSLSGGLAKLVRAGW